MEYSVFSKTLCMTDFSIAFSTIPCKQFYDIQQNQKLAACFIFIIEGKCELNSTLATISLEENDLVFIPENTVYSLDWLCEKNIKYYSITAVSKDYNTAMMMDRFCLQKIPELSNAKTRETYNEIYNLMKTDDRIEKIKALSIYYRFYADALSFLKHATINTSFHPSLLKAITFLQENYAEQTTVEELAKICFTSETRLYHLFQEQLHTTPTIFRNKIRVQKAIEHLKTDDVAIEEISYKVGFNSTAYFYRTFQKITGFTPSKYRNILK